MPTKVIGLGIDAQYGVLCESEIVALLTNHERRTEKQLMLVKRLKRALRKAIAKSEYQS